WQGVEVEQGVEDGVDGEPLALGADEGAFVDRMEPRAEEPLRDLEIRRVRRFPTFLPVDVIGNPPRRQRGAGMATLSLKHAAAARGGASVSGHGVLLRGIGAVRRRAAR